MESKMLDIFQFVNQSVSESKWAWLAESSAVIILLISTLAISSSLIYSRPVQRFWRDIKCLLGSLTEKANEMNESPYDRKIEESPAIAWFMIGWFYLMCAMMFIYGLPFAFIFSGIYGPEELPISKRLIALGATLTMWFFGRLLKVEGDKLLYKIRNR